jgi:hypothetical protein
VTAETVEAVVTVGAVGVVLSVERIQAVVKLRH